MTLSYLEVNQVHYLARGHAVKHGGRVADAFANAVAKGATGFASLEHARKALNFEGVNARKALELFETYADAYAFAKGAGHSHSRSRAFAFEVCHGVKYSRADGTPAPSLADAWQTFAMS
jgi:hypothetical protein